MRKANFHEARLTKLQERAGLSNPRRMLKKLLQDIDNLEKFYTDREYRNKLESASYLYSEYFELERIYEQDRKVKEKLNLPENSTIKYEKVKCCKDCTLACCLQILHSYNHETSSRLFLHKNIH